MCVVVSQRSFDGSVQSASTLQPPPRQVPSALHMPERQTVEPSSGVHGPSPSARPHSLSLLSQTPLAQVSIAAPLEQLPSSVGFMWGGSLGTGEPLASFGVHWCIDSSHQLPPLQSASTLQLPSGSHWPLALHMPLSQEAPPVAPGAVVLHALPLTILHVASQVSPAPPLLPPSSQPSPASRTPLPQLFAAEQRPGAAWPVVSQMPLSHELLPVEPGAVALQALPLTILQAASHVSPGFPLLPPWSHPSPASSTPLPQALAGAQTPGAGTPVVSQIPLAHDELPVEP